jgi:hypothetical protein
MWIPTNKKTGIRYPPITDAEKAKYEADPNLKGKYNFEAVSQSARIAPLPAEAKAAEAAKTEKLA